MITYEEKGKKIILMDFKFYSGLFGFNLDQEREMVNFLDHNGLHDQSNYVRALFYLSIKYFNPVSLNKVSDYFNLEINDIRGILKDFDNFKELFPLEFSKEKFLLFKESFLKEDISSIFIDSLGCWLNEGKIIFKNLNDK